MIPRFLLLHDFNEGAPLPVNVAAIAAVDTDDVGDTTIVGWNGSDLCCVRESVDEVIVMLTEIGALYPASVAGGQEG